MPVKTDREERSSAGRDEVIWNGPVIARYD